MANRETSIPNDLALDRRQLITGAAALGLASGLAAFPAAAQGCCGFWIPLAR